MTKVETSQHLFESNGIKIQYKTLKNGNQYDDIDNEAEKLGISSASWPLAGMIWPSGEILASLMATYDIEGLRILEMGCGVSLPSLVLNQRNADITASDQSPMSRDFLIENTNLNNATKIPFHLADWDNLDEDLGKFDLMIGSDLLYEPIHVSLLAKFVSNHAKENAKIILVDPRRGNLSKFKKEMTSQNFSHEVNYAEGFKGQIVTFIRQ